MIRGQRRRPGRDRRRGGGRRRRADRVRLIRHGTLQQAAPGELGRAARPPSPGVLDPLGDDLAGGMVQPVGEAEQDDAFGVQGQRAEPLRQVAERVLRGQVLVRQHQGPGVKERLLEQAQGAVKVLCRPGRAEVQQRLVSSRPRGGVLEIQIVPVLGLRQGVGHPPREQRTGFGQPEGPDGAGQSLVRGPRQQAGAQAHKDVAHHERARRPMTTGDLGNEGVGLRRLRRGRDAQQITQRQRFRGHRTGDPSGREGKYHLRHAAFSCGRAGAPRSCRGQVPDRNRHKTPGASSPATAWSGRFSPCVTRWKKDRD